MLFDRASYDRELSKNFKPRIVRQYLKHPKQRLNSVFHQISRNLAGGTEKLSHAWWDIPVLVSHKS